MVITVTSCLIGVVFASILQDYRAIIIKDLVALFLFTSFSFYSFKRRPKLRFGIEQVKYHWEFSKNILLNDLLTFTSRNIDDILIGQKFGSISLGIYSKSYNLLKLPISVLSKSISDVKISYLNKEDNKSVESHYIEALEILLYLNIPLCISIYYLGPYIISIFYKDSWSELIPLLKIFSIMSMFQSLGPLNRIIYEGKNKTFLLLRNNIITQAINISSILIGYFFGDSVLDIAYCYFCGNGIVAILNLTFLIRCSNLNLTDLIRTLNKYLIFGLCAFYLSKLLFDNLEMNISLISISICVSIIIMNFGSSFLLFNKKIK
jgi:O-antigen/teichoic acid export membrane protein